MAYGIGAVLVVIIVFLGLRYFSLKKEVEYFTQQLIKINQDVETNQYMRSATGLKQSQALLNELNTYMNQLRNYRYFYRKKELMLNKEINNVSHDLRTPLTAIKGYTEIIKETDNKEDLLKYIQVIDEKTTHLIKSVNLFHELTYLNAFDYELDLETMDIVEFIKAQFMSYFKQFDNKGIQITFENSNVLEVLAHKEAMIRVVNNIIQNVLRYGKNQAKVRFVETQEFINIHIENDTEYRMNDAQVQKLFERAYTLDESRTNQTTGVGLYIVKNLLERQRGQVSLQFEKPMFAIIMSLRKV
ncbi:HAMP domain-containing sensor histidine kinase [Staphylococcus sp. 11511212]|uniref:sensor histidine kinase n=1 Tax=Staphylococcus sp. 11511212 TaxID=2714544 RepID=UPI0014033288|nr:HAMP domain-containing sensor histidine kinase [Staphylococcus sp. 11511212]NHM77678.1 HAMP domain-containing histidine kinase [Staphylococcus sp. 11511212]